MKCESAGSRLALLCFAINHAKRCAERAVGAVKQLAGHREKKTQRREGKRVQRSMGLQMSLP